MKQLYFRDEIGLFFLLKELDDRCRIHISIAEVLIMKEVLKVVGILTAIIIIFWGPKFYQTSTVEGLLQHSNINYSEILHETTHDDNMYVFYSTTDATSLAVVHKNWYGYRLVTTAGGMEYEPNQDISWALTGLGNHQNNEGKTVFWGHVYDSQINTLMLKLNHGEEQTEIVSTHNGRIWYSILNVQASYSPEILATYENGQTKKVW